MTEPDELQEEMFAQLRDKQVFEQARSCAYAYMDGVREQNVFPTGEALRGLDAFD